MVHEPKAMRFGRCLQLTFGQRVELKIAAFVPKPGIGVGHAAHASGHWKRRRPSHRAFNFCHDFGGVAGRAHPACGGDLPAAIDFNLQYANCVQQWRQLAAEDAAAVLVIKVLGGILTVIARVACCGDG